VARPAALTSQPPRVPQGAAQRPPCQRGACRPARQGRAARRHAGAVEPGPAARCASPEQPPQPSDRDGTRRWSRQGRQRRRDAARQPGRRGRCADRRREPDRARPGRRPRGARPHAALRAGARATRRADRYRAAAEPQPETALAPVEPAIPVTPAPQQEPATAPPAPVPSAEPTTSPPAGELSERPEGESARDQTRQAPIGVEPNRPAVRDESHPPLKPAEPNPVAARVDEQASAPTATPVQAAESSPATSARAATLAGAPTVHHPRWRDPRAQLHRVPRRQPLVDRAPASRKRRLTGRHLR
jgi:hypothetical protein